jgi:Fur family ferric uptake transcriptional regulator
MSPANILKQHKMRMTESRKSILAVFISQNKAIGQPELEKQLAHFDRVTIYRCLNAFLEKGILHQVLDDMGATKYALCSEHCTEHEHQDEHIHFKCVSCERLECISDIQIPAIKLPNGYTFQDANLLVRGICKACQQ